ncbi:DEAD/DEAH box helicase [Methylacidimicrobium sp. B4]|uniref:type I-G CRISPR-associated helicase/endonuclease Cas3g n=1 Tax=Methylacidimicrobium sp. B4 TaxID=2796139 RepID=UPI001A8F37B4|nr:DEAD/DEAH box helicase [Methylacidimicrobium sp. B4]QSR84165.1 DEAD/DEAH box helicase [Methylacidimicrobium sp. B4]
MSTEDSGLSGESDLGNSLFAREQEFVHFFQSATGFPPYRWQICVALRKEGLPEILPVPTGLGKTEGSVLAWAWRRSVAGDCEPLHLIYCLPMRSLVRQTTTRLEGYFKKLQGQNGWCDIPVYQLIGGEADDTWTSMPDRSWVLVGTQDMLLSRALNRGYGVSRFDWPVHFGLLNQDCRWIIDEVQLMGPGLWTTAQLDWMRQKRFPSSKPCLKPCRTTWMSATMGQEFLQTTDRKRDGCDKVEAFHLDFDDASEEFKRRRSACRKTEIHKPKQGGNAKSVPEQIALEARDKHVPGTLTLIVCNTVETAQRVFQKLEVCKTMKKILITSRFRACDRRCHEQALLDFEARRSACSAGRVEDHLGLICVSTQVVEAGLDISAHRLWTEHAPWAPLIQRLGRLNRDGKDNEACAVVWKLTPEKKFKNEEWVGPYRKADLDRAWSLLEEFAPRSQARGKKACEALEELERDAPEAIKKAIAIPPEPCPRAFDMHALFSTEPDPYGGFTDVSRFVRGTDPDADVTVFWRDWDDRGPQSGGDLDGPPLDLNAETCPVAHWSLQKFLKTADEEAWLWNDEEESWSPVRPQNIKPGMIVMLRGNLGGYSRELGWTGEPEHRLSDLPQPGPGRALREDRRAEAGYWSSLPSHHADARREAENLCDGLHLEGPIRKAVVEATGNHDLGKAHPDWQGAVPKGGPLDHDAVAKFPTVLRVKASKDDVSTVRGAVEAKLQGAEALPDELLDDESGICLCWALASKSYDVLASIRALPGVRRAGYRAFRPGPEGTGMRHEAASALALWHQYRISNPAPYPALSVYLAAAHHGKVRTVLRSLSGKGDDVFGVDRKRKALEYDGREWPMDFSIAFDGAAGEWTDEGFEMIGPGWTGIVADLLGPWRGEADAAWTGSVPKDEPRAFGPFALAWLEALVRVADWRASKRASQIIRPGDGG